MDDHDEDFEDAIRNDMVNSYPVTQPRNAALQNHNNRKGNASLILIKTTKNHFRRFLEYVRGLPDEDQLPFSDIIDCFELDDISRDTSAVDMMKYVGYFRIIF